MGASHAVISLGSLEPPGADDTYFSEFGIVWPDDVAGARDPTPREVRAALGRLDGYQTRYAISNSSLDIDVNSLSDPTDWAVIWIEDYVNASCEDTPLSITFHRGNDELVLRIVGELAKTCGPFLVMLNMETPRLVTG